MTRVILFLISLLLVVPAAHAQFGAKQKKWKMGLNRFSSTVNYEYQTQRMESATSTAVEKKVSKKSGGGISTTDFTFEYIFKGYFGIELDFNITPGVRNFSFKETTDAEVLIGDVVENVKTELLYGVNFYFNDHSSGGIKWFIGLLTGSYLVDHTYSNGGERDDDEEDELTLFKSSMNSSLRVPVQVIKLGMDWILENVGIRLQMVSIEGEVTSTQGGLGRTGLSQKQKETFSLSGGFTIGLFAHF